MTLDGLLDSSTKTSQKQPTNDLMGRDPGIYSQTGITSTDVSSTESVLARISIGRDDTRQTNKNGFLNDCKLLIFYYMTSFHNNLIRSFD